MVPHVFERDTIERLRISSEASQIVKDSFSPRCPRLCLQINVLVIVNSIVCGRRLVCCEDDGAMNLHDVCRVKIHVGNGRLSRFHVDNLEILFRTKQLRILFTDGARSPSVGYALFRHGKAEV